MLQGSIVYYNQIGTTLCISLNAKFFFATLEAELQPEMCTFYASLQFQLPSEHRLGKQSCQVSVLR